MKSFSVMMQSIQSYEKIFMIIIKLKLFNNKHINPHPYVCVCMPEYKFSVCIFFLLLIFSNTIIYNQSIFLIRKKIPRRINLRSCSLFLHSFHFFPPLHPQPHPSGPSSPDNHRLEQK